MPSVFLLITPHGDPARQAAEVRGVSLTVETMNLGNSQKKLGFPGGTVVKNPPANAVDVDLIPGSGRSPGEGNSNPLWYTCLGNPMDRGG